ncbi:MAG: solute carrier family 26 protein [Lewinellaceae bacterium]|nr:solute carrier family 26 protein [Saprospiraceae bacterium]MCB9312136.1 solute carrier family 26 protein [Lewinellaceae bacterium]HRW76345.1 solute carrier family 26 protein [Saprospiraceae bacterium]
MSFLSRFIPSLHWLPAYNSDQLQGDLSAGLTVGVMLIPQGMAYAMIAGLPPVYGLYASTIPLILYALLGTSRQLAVGPVAMVSLLTAAGVATLAEPGSDTYIALAIALALMVGIIQFLLGAFRLGFLVNFLSHPVVSGFTSAAALIIGFSQLKHLLGISLPKGGHVHEILLAAVRQIDQVHLPTFLLGAGGILVILVARRIDRRIPAPLLAVLLGILAVSILGLDQLGVRIVGEIPVGLPSLSLPALNGSVIQSLLATALAISLVSFMESIAVAKAIQSRHRVDELDPNQELIALGAANIGGAFFQSYPVTGGFSRTAVNDQAGARSGLASIISAGLILLTLLFLTPLFHNLPNAILAAVIMVAVFGLIDYKEVIHLWHTDRSDLWMLAVTFVATLALGIEEGILIGVVLSLGLVIYRTSRPHIATLGRVPGSDFYRNVERFDHLEIRPDILILRLDAQLYFANLNYCKDQIRRQVREKGPALRCLVLNAESISHIDSSAAQMLHDLIRDLRGQGLTIMMNSIIGPVRDRMAAHGLLDLIGADHIQMSVQDAVDAFDAMQGRQPLPEQYSEYASQANAL